MSRTVFVFIAASGREAMMELYQRGYFVPSFAYIQPKNKFNFYKR